MSKRIHSQSLKDRNRMKEMGYGDCNFYTLSPVGIRYARDIYIALRRNGVSEWKARHMIWTLIFTTKINLLPLNHD